MVSRDVQEAIRSDALLGEGPRWDAATGRLLWVDIERGLLHVSNPGNGEDRAIALGARVGAAAPTDTGDVLVALAHRLALVDLASESLRSLAAFPHDEDVRANDGACDPAGRSWIGTNALDFAPGRGALYRYTGGGLERMLDSVTLSNGLGWSPDGRLMYYIDWTSSGSTSSISTPVTARSPDDGSSPRSTGWTERPTGSPSTTRAASGSRSTAAAPSAVTRPTEASIVWSPFPPRT